LSIVKPTIPSVPPGGSSDQASEFLARRGTAHLENPPACGAHAALGEERLPDRPAVGLTRIELPSRLKAERPGKLLLVDIDRRDLGAERMRDLHGVCADPADADDHDQVARVHARPLK
jgi:hypothetical protein